MSKRAFLVLGPESSGTRLMTRLLVAAGCFGDGGHEQRLDKAILDHPLIAWRRSVPHRKQWPDVGGMIQQLQTHDYDVTVLVMSRDWHAMSLSQVAAPHVADVAAAHEHIQRAYCAIFDALCTTQTPFEVVNYEALTQRPQETVATLMQRLGLSVQQEVRVYDGNARYYEAVTHGA